MSSHDLPMAQAPSILDLGRFNCITNSTYTDFDDFVNPCSRKDSAQSSPIVIVSPIEEIDQPAAGLTDKITFPILTVWRGFSRMIRGDASLYHEHLFTARRKQSTA